MFLNSKKKPIEYKILHAENKKLHLKANIQRI